MKAKKNVIKGIILPTPTFLHEKGSIDITANRLFIERLFNEDDKPYVNGLLVNGLTGEAPWLDLNQKMTNLEIMINSVDRRIPILFGVLEKKMDCALWRQLRLLLPPPHQALIHLAVPC